MHAQMHLLTQMAPRAKAQMQMICLRILRRGARAYANVAADATEGTEADEDDNADATPTTQMQTQCLAILMAITTGRSHYYIATHHNPPTEYLAQSRARRRKPDRQ